MAPATRAAWRTLAGLPPIKPFAQKKVTFFQEASWKLWRVLCLLALGRIRQTQGPEGQGRRLVGQGYGGEQVGPAGFPPPCRSLTRVPRAAWRSAPTAPSGRRGGRPRDRRRGHSCGGTVAAGSEGKGWSRSRGEREEAACSLPGPSAPRWPVGGWVGAQVGLGTARAEG